MLSQPGAVNGMRIRGMFVAAAATIFALASVAEAQQPASATGWYSYYGCWKPVGAPNSPSLQGDPDRAVCIIPVENTNAVQLLSIRGDSVLERVRINTSGERTPATREGCSGWESATRGSAGRVYLKSEYLCDAGVQRSTSGMAVMLSPEEWLDVQTVTVAGQSSVMMQRYAEATPPAAVATEVSNALRDKGMAIASARVAATGAISLDDIIDASRNASPSTVEAWLLEKKQGFVLQAKHVDYLDDSRVPGSTIDMIVALSFPGEFGRELSQKRLALYPVEAQTYNSTRVASEDYVVPPTQNYNTGVDRYYMDRHYYGPSGYYRHRFYSPFGYYYYGSSWFDYPYYYNRPPVVVIIQDGDGGGDGGAGGGGTGGGGSGGGSSNPPARLVNGRGYTNGVQSSTGTSSQSTNSSGDVPGSTAGSTAAPPPSGNNSARYAAPRPATTGTSNAGARSSTGNNTAGSRTSSPPARVAAPRTNTGSSGAAKTSSSGASKSSGSSASKPTTAKSSGTSSGGSSSNSTSSGSSSSGSSTTRTAKARGGG